MKHWKQTAAMGALLLTVAAAPAWATELAVPISAPAMPADGVLARTFSGRLTHVDLEGGFYAVDGWRLIGDDAEFAKYLGQEVVVTGTEFTGISFQMVPAINVATIQLRPAAAQTEVSAQSPLPKAILFNGKAIASDQAPVVEGGILLVPLRAIVDAAGGQITWNAEEQSMQVRMKDRTVHLAIGNPKAEVNVDGVYYVTRNFITMAAAPTIVGERTMISADALTAVLGLMQAQGEAGLLNLVPAASPELPGAPSEEEQSRLVGKIREVASGEKPRILVEGSVMPSGGTMLIWLSVSEKTQITVGEAGGTAADLQVGAAVEVVLTGPILESYPAQGGAASIRVIPAAKSESIRGAIKELEPGRILVEGSAMANGEPNLLYLHISEKTRIVVVEAGEERAATAGELEKGQQVEAEYSGPVMLSYPGQVGADLIRILK